MMVFRALIVSVLFLSSSVFAQPEEKAAVAQMQKSLLAAEAATESLIVASPEELIPSRRKRWSPWSVSYFNWATQDMDKTREGKAQLTSYNHLSFSYRLDQSSISIRPIFFVNGAGEDYRDDLVDSSVEMGDIYLQYANYNMALLPGNIGLYGAFRWYLPLSRYSKDTGKVGELRAKLIFSKPWGYGWQTNYVFEPKYSIHHDRGYVDRSFYRANVKANKWGEVRHYLETAKLFNPTHGASFQVGGVHKMYYDVPAEGISSSFRDDLELALYYILNLDHVGFKIGVKNAIDVRTPNDRYATPGPFQIFKEADTQYSIMTYIHL